jgi:hypothetical protein
MFKVYNIYSGRTVKAGFAMEDEAQDWLDEADVEMANYAIEEMEIEEEEEFSNDRSEEGTKTPVVIEDEDDGFRKNFIRSDGDKDDGDDDDDDDEQENFYSEFDPDDDF